MHVCPRCHFGPNVLACNDRVGATACYKNYERNVGKDGKHRCRREWTRAPRPAPPRPATIWLDLATEMMLAAHCDVAKGGFLFCRIHCVVVVCSKACAQAQAAQPSTR